MATMTQGRRRCTGSHRGRFGGRVLWSRVRALLSGRRSGCDWSPPGYLDLPPDAPVREPRRPGPLPGAGAAALPEPNGIA